MKLTVPWLKLIGFVPFQWYHSLRKPPCAGQEQWKGHWFVFHWIHKATKGCKERREPTEKPPSSINCVASRLTRPYTRGTWNEGFGWCFLNSLVVLAWISSWKEE
jgi:hypothetical protein